MVMLAVKVEPSKRQRVSVQVSVRVCACSMLCCRSAGDLKMEANGCPLGAPPSMPLRAALHRSTTPSLPSTRMPSLMFSKSESSSWLLRRLPKTTNTRPSAIISTKKKTVIST